MSRLRGLLWPVTLVGCAVLLLALNRTGNWHSNKAEAGGWMFLVVGVIWFGASMYRVIKPLPIAVGVEVVIMLGDQPESGTVTKMEGDLCTVTTARGAYLVDRYAIVSLMKKR